MWITRLQLTNIKSYGPESTEIRFHQGVNLIQGQNGAGKSTILEAIGLALFGSTPYTREQLIREGAKRGEIMVGFVSAADQREYEVVRKMGGGSAFVHDPEANRRVCEGVNDTTAFIRQHLNIEADTDLAPLFTDAVGVPQGTMTAIFLEKASVRKEKFNRLLRVDAYERAWENLRKTNQLFDKLAQENEVFQASLGGQLAALPAAQAEAERLAGETAAEQFELDNVTQQLEVVSIEVDSLDKLKKQLDDQEKQLLEFNAEVRSLTRQCEQDSDRLAEAEEAQAIVAETADACRIFEQAQARLTELEGLRLERDRITSEQHKLEVDLRLCQQEIDRLAGERDKASQARSDAEALKPLVAEQDQVELALAQAEADGEAGEQLTAAIERHTARALTGSFEQMAGEWMAAGEGVPPRRRGEPQGASLEDQAEAARATMAALTTEFSRWQDARTHWQAAERELRNLQKQAEERAALQGQLDDLVGAWNTLAERRDDARVTYGQLNRELDLLREYEQLLAGAGAACPVCHRPLDEHSRADTVAHYTVERGRLQERSEATQSALQAAQTELDALEKRRGDLIAQIDALPGEASLDQARRQLQEAQAELESRQGELAESFADAGAALEDLELALTGAKARAAELADSAARIPALQRTLAELDNPRYRYDRACEQTAREADIAAEMAGQEAQRDRLQADLDEINRQLAKFATLDVDLAAAQNDRDTNSAAHQRYLSYIHLAEQVEARRDALASLHDELDARRQEQLALQSERDARAADYDADRHTAAKEEQDSLKLQQARLETSLKERRKALTSAQAKLNELAEVQSRLEQAGRDAARLAARRALFDFLRDRIRQAGPRITEQLVRVIADQATHILGDIFGDHSLVLDWSDDYAISLIDRGEKRSFELLSGGEQMAAAIAIRLALLMHLANVQFAFFDEPTTNLDEIRRSQLASRLGDIQSLQQLFVISHDDTFEHENYHVLQVRKENGISRVDAL